MTPASVQQDDEDWLKARWRGGPTVLAFLFAHPDGEAIRLLDARGEYFDHRTGETWDLFFPGYYRSAEGQGFETEAGSRPIGRRYARDWYFSPSDFDQLRTHLERHSRDRWQYSGAADLVLINAWLPERGEPTIDWDSTFSGQVNDQIRDEQSVTIAEVIERISRDIENAAEDAWYGVGDVSAESTASLGGQGGRDFMINALAGIAAALGVRALGG